VSETIKVSKETKRSLIKIAARIRASTGKRVDFGEVILYVISESQKRPDLLDRVFGSVPELSYEDLRRERETDLMRA
jgi:hypothetical protein